MKSVQRGSKFKGAYLKPQSPEDGVREEFGAPIREISEECGEDPALAVYLPSSLSLGFSGLGFGVQGWWPCDNVLPELENSAATLYNPNSSNPPFNAETPLVNRPAICPMPDCSTALILSPLILSPPTP